MLEFLPDYLREGLEHARKRQARRRSRLHVQVGDAVFPILRMWAGGFALDGALSPRLRGLVDVYDGPRHILHCLIIASDADGGEIMCEFKQSSPAGDRPPVDFWRGDEGPAGYLTRD